MRRIVMKFGGTSLANLTRIEHAAELVKREVEAGLQVAVVVSAMAGETDKLIELVSKAGGFIFDAREYDAVVSNGENVTAGLLALVLQRIGVSARSWRAWQIPIRTDGTHLKARILDIDTQAIERRFKESMVAVCAGFQGIGPRQRITTLGRGGSDTAAVAIAAALKAERCDIYTDVDGIYTSDPRIVPAARKINVISYEEMLELASLGAKVLHSRSVEMSACHNVPIRVLSSFDDKPGTTIQPEDKIMEQYTVQGITYDKNEAQILLEGIADKPGISASILGPLADAAINIDMIIQALSLDGQRTNITFTVPRSDLSQAVSILEKNQAKIGFHALHKFDDVAKISVVGLGMRSHAGVALTMFKTMAEDHINIKAISTSEIKISILIDEKYLEVAMRSLHHAYGLDSTED